VFENLVVNKMSGLEREEVLYKRLEEISYMELHELYFFAHFITMIISKMMTLAEHVADVGESTGCDEKACRTDNAWKIWALAVG